MEREQRERRVACRTYFLEHPVFDRLLKGFREKYVSYGRFAGTVILRNLTEEEREDLEGFLQKNYHGKQSASVSAARFERALSESRFAGISGKEALELYFGSPVEGKREQRLREERKWAELLEKAGQAAGQRAGRWLEDLGKGQDSGKFVPYLKKRCREAGGDFAEAGRLLLLGVRVLDRLPEDRKYLAVFAAETTGNPHAFDAGTKDGTYLEMLVRWFVGMAAKTATETAVKTTAGTGKREFPALEKQKLFLQAGILRDDVSNYALAAGIHAWEEDGHIHRGMEGFFDEAQPVQIPLSAIAGWSRVDCPGKRMYIVENPSVYAMLCGKWRGDCGLMCMNGQPRLSSMLLLDLLAKSDTVVYYAGDFDPEGLLIAQRLKRYYDREFHFWHMTAEEYRKSMSGEEISPRRLKMLERVTDPDLIGTAKAIGKEKRAGYQENIWEAYAILS